MSDHLPLCLTTRVKCNQTKSATQLVDAPVHVPPIWDNTESNSAYDALLQDKLRTLDVSNLTTTQESIDGFMDQLNKAMHDATSEAGCRPTHINKPKPYWCPEMSRGV